MKFYLLASGSYGNSTLIDFKGTTFLVDVGLRIREITKKLELLGASLDSVDAIFVTHEHSDHQNARTLAHVDLNKLYATKETLYPMRYNYISPLKMFEIKGITIIPIPMSHDVRNGVGYVFIKDDETLVYLTDTGYVNKRYWPFMENATHYIFESNHDPEMLIQTDRPAHLKQRILSDEGHLCNEDCGEILSNLVGPKTRSITLAHISEDANTPQLAVDTVTAILRKRGIDVSKILIQAANRYDITEGGDISEA